jgi:hypothetical protein
MEKWIKPLRKHIAETISAIWDFTAGLKAAKIGIGQAPGTELLEIAKDTDVGAIVGRSFSGYNGVASDAACFGHIDSKAYPAVRQNANGFSCFGSAGATSIQAVGSEILSITQYDCTINAGKYLYSVFVSDTDSDTNDVLSTGITTKFGLVLIKETTGNKFCLFRIKGDNSAPVIIDGDAEFTVTKDTDSSYNFYYETDQFKLQNKVGDNKALYVGLYLV